MTQDWYDEQFDLQRKNPVFWFLKARRLKRASDLTWSEYESAAAEFKRNPDDFFRKEREDPILGLDLELFEPALFLLALAIENLAKGLLVTSNPDYFNQEAPTHGVVAYVDQCGVAISEKQRALLGEVEAIIKWKGRYPTPVKLMDWRLRQGSYGPGTRPGTIEPSDKAFVDGIFDNLASALIEEYDAGIKNNA